METQVKAYYSSPEGLKFVTIFGYTTKGVPGLEINGIGKLSKNVKEKLIFLTRSRKLPLPLRRFVICVDVNDLSEQKIENLKWLEFPLLLMFWFLGGMIPISKLNDCLCSGWIAANGNIYQMPKESNLYHLAQQEFTQENLAELKIIHQPEYGDDAFWLIESSLLLEHIPRLKFCIDHSVQLKKMKA